MNADRAKARIATTGLGKIEPQSREGMSAPGRCSVLASVAAVIVNYNGGPFLQACMRSLSAQSHPLTKVFVVDNASIDNSLATIEHEPCCEIVRLNQNAGFAVASNRAVALAEGCEWLLMLNPDATLEPDWLERMLEAAAKHSDCAMLASRLLQHEHRNLLDGAGDVFHVSGAHWRRGHGQIDKGQFMADEEVFSPCAAAALYRRDVFLAVGGFDEAFFCYGEDVDLAFRLRLMGERCMYVPHAIARHVGSASSGRNSDFAVYHGHRNLVWLYLKNMPGLLLFLYLPQHLIWNLVSILWFVLRGQSATILRAKRDALRSLPRVLRERRRVQSQRKVGCRALLRVMGRGFLRPYFRSLTD
jgi:GT2 family glycosyltransferase